jgi:SWI/SNF-related matrix-associated actin-dependent regulator of chromatin subfamily A3
MLEVDAKLRAGNNKSSANDYYTFNIKKVSNQVVLRFQDSTDFGILNTHTSKALEGLIDQPSIQFDALGPILTIREAIGRSTKANDAVVRVNINVYGPKGVGKDVGCHLSDRKVFLQRPDIQRPGSFYDNPHILKFPDMQISSLEYQVEAAPYRTSTSEDAECFRKTISNVYASLTRGAKLNRVEGDRRLKTQLLL